jgi:hypothetical protein
MRARQLHRLVAVLPRLAEKGPGADYNTVLPGAGRLESRKGSFNRAANPGIDR